MAIHDVWFSNLKTLIDAEGGGRRGIRAVADATGLSEEYVYQLANKKPNSKGVPREVGKDAAKKIAIAFAQGRDESWFDLGPRSVTAPPNYKPNQPLAGETVASYAININANRRAKPKAQEVVTDLGALLANADPAVIDGLAGLLASFARAPSNAVLINTLAELLEPAAFTQQEQRTG